MEVQELNSAHIGDFSPRHILDLYCVQLSNIALFCKNYAKLYFDAKHLEKGLHWKWVRGGVKFLGAFFSKASFFHKKVIFVANIECCPKFLEYALLRSFFKII